MPRRLLIAGLDYGTSFTKIVIRDNNTPGMHAKVVTTENYSEGLFPSLIGIRDGNFLFPPAERDAVQIPYAKMLPGHIAEGGSLHQSPIPLPPELHALADGIGDDRAFVHSLLAFYFANLVSTVEVFITGDATWRDFDFRREHHDDHLIYQLAVPSGLMNSTGDVERLFREALIGGYLLRRHPILARKGGVPVSEWHQLVTSACEMKSSDWEKQFEWQCLVYPETAGAVQAYFRSPNASDGLFITMDVGAGTVDLNAFRRQQESRNSSYYATIVCPLGLQNIRHPLTSHSPRGENAIMEELRHRIHAINLLARKYQPNHGIRPGTRTWDRATFFIFGGGAHYQPYWHHYEAGLQYAGICAPQILRLPSASDLDRPRSVDFGRFAVAYGLSFFKPSLDHVKLPHELETFESLYPKSDADRSAPYGFNWED